jgi:glucose/mannose-6-phosphate isomerase
LIDLDDIGAIEKLDSLDMLGEVESFADKVRGALGIAEAATGLPEGLGVDSVAVLGMGGSGSSGDLIRALVEPRLPVPFAVIKSYSPLPEWIGRNTLVMAVSYSGNTEETIDAFVEAQERGARIVSLSAGGRLADMAQESGAAHIKVPSGLQPRSAVAYLLVPLLLVLARMGLVPDPIEDIEESMSVLADMAPRCGRKTPVVENPAKDLAARLAGKVPVLYGGPGIGAAIARRFKCELNEYAKAHAFFNELPEMNHNEIVGWTKAAEIGGPYVAVWFRDSGDDYRVGLRWKITRSLIEDSAADIVEVSSEGESPLARMTSLLFLTQLAAIYTGLAHGVDPGPVEVLENLKQRLAAMERTTQ